MTVDTCKLMAAMPIEEVPLPVLQADLEYHLEDGQECREKAAGLPPEEAEWYLESLAHNQRVVKTIRRELERRKNGHTQYTSRSASQAVAVDLGND